jgi:hypothetical protein
MTNVLFAPTFYLTVPFWALMIVAPGWSWTRRVIASPLIAVPPLLVYLVDMLPHLSGFLTVYTRPNLAVVQTLLGTPYGTGAEWAHLVAFDLLVARWIYLDSRKKAIHPLAMAPILLLTMLMGAPGFLLYLLLRYTVHTGQPASATAGVKN